MIKTNLLKLIAAGLLFTAACNSPSGIERIENKLADGGKEVYERRAKDYAKQGLYQRFAANGTIAEQVYFQNDTLQGERKLFYPNGTLETLETYRNGQFHGVFKHFYENGVLEIELPYEQNAIQGIARAWYPNGVLKEVVSFKDNEENGPFQEFYENGNKKAEGTYSPGEFEPLEQGELKEYDETGRHIRTALCKSGICNTVWKMDADEAQ